MKTLSSTKLIGTIITSTADFKNTSHFAVTPTTVTFKYSKPNGQIFTTIVPPVSGKYSQDVYLNESGVWHFRWETSVDYGVAEEFQINVEASKIGMYTIE